MTKKGDTFFKRKSVPIYQECRTCHETKHMTEFIRYDKGKEIYKTDCHSCQKEKGRNYQREKPEQYKSKDRDRKLRKAYGISLHDFHRIKEDQNHCCAICGEEPVPTKAHPELVVDHCHEGGFVRELLCHFCNKGLGHFKDNYETLLKAARYLKKHKENNTHG